MAQNESVLLGSLVIISAGPGYGRQCMHMMIMQYSTYGIGTGTGTSTIIQIQLQQQQHVLKAESVGMMPGH